MSASATRMNPEVKQIFLEALRSGDYWVGRLFLNVNNKHFCALGVLCELAVKAGITQKFTKEYAHYYGTESKKLKSALPIAVQKWAGLKDELGSFDADSPNMSIAGVSDYHQDFNVVADYVERYL